MSTAKGDYAAESTMHVAEGSEFDQQESFPHLAAAPIVEAVIHWRARAAKWPDSEQLRQTLLQQLQEGFADYPECHPQHAMELRAELGADDSSTQIHRTSWHGVRLVSEDKLHIVQFTRDGVAFSRVTPYENWEAFVAEAWRWWQAFLAWEAPTEVQRLGARFINRIALQQPSDVQKYLTSPPECLEAAGLPTTDFLYQSRHSVPGQSFDVNVVRLVQPPGPEGNAEFGLIVDIDVGTTRPLPCENDVLQDRLTALHRLKNTVFFKLLRPEAIEGFKKGPS